MIRYWCDLCEKEMPESDRRIIRLPIPMTGPCEGRVMDKSFEVCGECLFGMAVWIQGRIDKAASKDPSALVDKMDDSLKKAFGR